MLRGQGGSRQTGEGGGLEGPRDGSWAEWSRGGEGHEKVFPLFPALWGPWDKPLQPHLHLLNGRTGPDDQKLSALRGNQRVGRSWVGGTAALCSVWGTRRRSRVRGPGKGPWEERGAAQQPGLQANGRRLSSRGEGSSCSPGDGSESVGSGRVWRAAENGQSASSLVQGIPSSRSPVATNLPWG